MRNLKYYSAREWLRLLPLKHAIRETRDDVWLRYYIKFRSKALDSFLRETEWLKNRNIALVVAFEQPWALDWLLQMAGRHLTDTAILVFDNSRQTTVRQEIARVCHNRETPYLALPVNPTRHGNRSHGMAMTWIFYNVIQAIRPRIFAFLDHDMIPVKKTVFSERLADQAFFGLPNVSAWAWQLWAGYCLFDFSRVAGLSMNFLHNFPLELDTGGRNWACLYQNYDRSRLRFARQRFVSAKDPSNGESHPIQIVDDRWFHIGSISYNNNFRAKSQFCENLAQALNQGISCPRLFQDADAP